MTVRLQISRVILDQHQDWSERELIFLCFMHKVWKKYGYKHPYNMHSTDVTSILGLSTAYDAASLRNLNRVMNIGRINSFTYSIQLHENLAKKVKAEGGQLPKSQVLTVSDPSAVAMHYYLTAVAAHKPDIVSDEGKYYTERMEDSKFTHLDRIYLNATEHGNNMTT